MNSSTRGSSEVQCRPIPAFLVRVTDDKSFIKLGIAGGTNRPDPDVGFEVGYSTACIEFCHRLTPASVKCHLSWSPVCDWKGLISLCGTIAKAEREVAWRQSKKRSNIRASFISTSALHWEKLPWNDATTIDVLTDNGDEPVYFFKATELIEKFGLRNSMRSNAAIGGSQDEWLALEWIPRRMIHRVDQLW